MTSPVSGEWQVAFYSGDQEFVQVIVSSADGRVLGTFTGIKIAWTMARGLPGAFGRHVDALYVWLPLCLLFLAPFFDWRSPLRLRNVDLLVLTSLSISLAFFNHADIYQSVPLAYPPLVYLLLRLVWLARPRAPAPPPLRLNFGPGVLAVVLVALIAFRVTLNVVDSNVIDVGFANVVGAQKVIDGKPLYGQFPATIARGDTYGPVSYVAYVPFVAALGFSGSWDSLPAAHAAAICFDSLAIALLFALGWRIRGPSTGLVLAYAWAAFPFTAFALECNSNDALVAALVTATLLAATSPPARGAFAALAGLTKYAPLALAPVLATYRLQRRGARGLAAFALAFAAAAALASIPALDHNSLATIFSRSVSYQADRSAPFSIWGLYGGLRAAQTAVQALAVALALGLALQRRDDPLRLAAAAAAILIAVELGVTYWFYLYIPWFFAPAAVALLGGAPRFERRPRRRSKLRGSWVVWDGTRGAWLLNRPKTLLSGGRERALR
ncbi:MAG TPA: glycosyltransferase 87 family protein [Solirubrobacteraceae bacterium]|nr:glycosyltransferase 87 family protein [Solirubrobacteraceae bacterium]